MYGFVFYIFSKTLWVARLYANVVFYRYVQCLLHIGLFEKSKKITNLCILCCIFQCLQHLRKSLENDSKMSPKMTPESMKKWSRSLSGRGSQKKQQKDDIFYEKCPKNDPGGTPKWSQNPSQIILLTGSRPPGSNFWSQGCPGGGYPPQIDSKIIKN